MIRRPAKWDILSTRRRENTNGLVGWWTFQDGTAMDWSGNQNNGVLVGSPNVVSGIIGNALSFTGSQSVTIANSLITGTGNWTILAWINSGSFNFNTRGNIFQTGNSGTNAGLYLYINSSKLRFDLSYTAGPVSANNLPCLLGCASAW